METPYGDATDILLSDAPGYILQRYPVVVVASRLRSARKETAAKLVEYVAAGGVLVLTADASESLGPLLGAAVPSMDPRLCKTLGRNTTVSLTDGGSSSSVVEPQVWSVCPVICQPTSGTTTCTTVATVGGDAVAVEISAGKGKMLLLGSSGVSSSPAVALPITSAEEKELSNPYPMREFAFATAC